MKYELTEHARTILEERQIPISYLERVIQNPELSLKDENDTHLEHLLGKIHEYDNRVLRVVINKNIDPMRIVTVYYDRTMRGKL